MSILTVNTGSMFSGKSTLLISQGEKHAKAGQRVIYIKPDIDTRYSQHEIVTHEGIKVPALTVPTNRGLSDYICPKEVDVVLIDEAQFFTKRICNSIWWLLSEGVKVYVSGLDMNYMTDGFETMAELMCMADKVNKLKAVCECCGNDANLTGKRNFFGGKPSGNIVELGEKETYFPVCRSCFFKLVRGKLWA